MENGFNPLLVSEGPVTVGLKPSQNEGSMPTERRFTAHIPARFEQSRTVNWPRSRAASVPTILSPRALLLPVLYVQLLCSFANGRGTESFRPGRLKYIASQFLTRGEASRSEAATCGRRSCERRSSEGLCGNFCGGSGFWALWLSSAGTVDNAWEQRHTSANVIPLACISLCGSDNPS